MTTIKSIMKYPGSKANIAPWIVRHLPSSPFYLDLFCGSGAIWFALWSDEAHRPRSAVLNDLEGEIVNLLRVLRNRETRAELCEAIALTPWAREEYNASRIALYSSRAPVADPVERARLYLIQLWQGHGSATGGRSTVGWRHQGLGGMKTNTHTWQLWRQLPDRLAAAAEALTSAEIECTPARQLLPRYNDPDVLIYADPPYLGSTRNGGLYRHEMRGVLEHARLLRDLRRHRGPVALSGYRHALYDRLLPNWRRVEKVAQAEKGQTRIECLWINPVTQARLSYGPLFEIAQ